MRDRAGDELREERRRQDLRVAAGLIPGVAEDPAEHPRRRQHDQDGGTRTERDEPAYGQPGQSRQLSGRRAVCTRAPAQEDLRHRLTDHRHRKRRAVAAVNASHPVTVGPNVSAKTR